MGRKVDPKTATLYCYVRPAHRDYVRQMRKYFNNDSNYIDALIKKDMIHESLKNEILKKLKKDAEKLALLKETAHD